MEIRVSCDTAWVRSSSHLVVVALEWTELERHLSNLFTVEVSISR